MKCSVICFTLFISILEFYAIESSSLMAQSYLPPRCPPVKLPNGRVRQRSRGRMLRFNCLPGFILVGNRYATCIRTKWDTRPPVCVNTRCPPLKKPEHSILVEKYDGAIVMIVCEPGYERKGPTEIYCNGKDWNETAPVCRSTNAMAPTSCDFEKPDLCGWEQDPLHDFDWIRQNFNTPSWKIGTGPSHDHTLGAGNDGYYMYIEATDRMENSTARLMSPLYSANLTAEGCFSFWYHMYGITIGTLNVYFKAEGEADRKLMFTKSGNQGNQWWHGLFYLPRENTSFQLIVEGVRGAGYISDIAIDDLAILQGTECMPDGDTTTIILPTGNDDQVEIVNAMQTCKGRCSYSVQVTTPNDLENPQLCQCDSFCYENHNCCPDYPAYCIDTNDGTYFSSDYSEDPTESIIIPSIIPDLRPIPISPKDDIDPFVSRPVTPSNIPTNKVPSTFKPQTPKTTTKRTPIEIITLKPDQKRTTVNNIIPSDSESTTIMHDFDNQIDTNKQTETDAQKSSRDPVKVTLPGVIGIVVGAIVGVAVMGVIVFRVLQKRKNYKNGAGTSALSDDSDVRFLTSDEMLDFSLARPEDMEVM